MPLNSTPFNPRNPKTGHPIHPSLTLCCGDNIVNDSNSDNTESINKINPTDGYEYLK